MQQTARQTIMWPLAIVLILCSFRAEWQVWEFTTVEISLMALMPILAGFLGMRFGRQGLRPFYYAAPVLLLSVYLTFDYHNHFSSGLSIGAFVLLWLIARQFAQAPLDERATTETDQWILFSLFALVASISGYVGLEPGDDVRLQIFLNPEMTLPAVAFLMAVFGRLTPMGLVKGIMLFVALLAVQGALWEWGSEYIPEPLFDENELLLAPAGDDAGSPLESHWRVIPPSWEAIWTLDWTYMELDVRSGWRAVPMFTLPLMIAAGLLGAALSSLFRFRSIGDERRNRHLLLLALVAVMVLPSAATAAQRGIHAADTFWAERMERQAAQAPKVQLAVLSSVIQDMAEDDSEPDVIIVTAQKREQTLFDVPIVNTISSVIIAGIAFGFGFVFRHRARLLATTVIPLAAVAGTLLRQLASLGDYYGALHPMELYSVVGGVFLATVILAWVAASMGAAMRTQIDWKVAGRDPDATDPIGPDLTQSAQVARWLDVSSTLRAFTVLVAFGITYVNAKEVWSVGGVFIQSTFEYGIDWFPLFMFIALLLSVILIPLGVVMIDWMSRQRLYWISGLLAAWAGLSIVYIVIFTCALIIAAINNQILRYGVDYGLFEVVLFIGAVVGTLWLAIRAFKLESYLTKPVPRSALMGIIDRPTLRRRLAFLLGLPSSRWRWNALDYPSTYFLLLARPIVYLGFLILLRAQEMYYISLNSIWVYQLPQEWLRAYLEGGAISIYGLGIAVIILGHFVFVWGKKMSARRIWSGDVSSGYGPPPILFLRSFKDDQLTFRRKWYDMPGKWFDLWSFRTNVDELLVDEFAQLGPIVALGKPGDTSRRFGAQRRFTDHDEWQQVIRETAERAQVIVVAAGDTPGLKWEYDLIRDQGYLDKTIFLFPSAAPGAPRVVTAMNIFAKAYPDLDPGAAIKEKAPIALIPSEPRDRLWSSDRASAQAYLVALRRYFRKIA